MSVYRGSFEIEKKSNIIIFPPFVQYKKKKLQTSSLSSNMLQAINKLIESEAAFSGKFLFARNQTNVGIFGVGNYFAFRELSNGREKLFLFLSITES